MNIMRVKVKALELLLRIEAEGAYTHLVLQQAADSGESPDGEYPVLLQLVRGTLEQRGTLEVELNKFLSQGLHSLPLEVQLVLRMAAYQLRFLDRVKKRDVVFEAVELVKRGRYRGFAGLVNAVLRKIDSSNKTGQDKRESRATANFPDWLIDRWMSQHDAREIESFCKASDSPLPMYLRVNTLATSAAELQVLLVAEGVKSEFVEVSANSLRVTKLPPTIRITQLASYQAGLFFIQDASSTIVSDIVTDTRPRHVRDLCAAPGGKTCSIALSIASHGGTVHASDRAAKRVSLINSLAARLKLLNIMTETFDLASRRKEDPEELYDAVLLDAPCSGFGTVGRKVDVRWSVTESDLATLNNTQGALLRAAARFVRPQGFLVYSTCSIDKAENEQVVERFLSEQDDFVRVDLREIVPPHVCTEKGYFRSWPHHHRMAGAFAAKLKRIARSS